jgi:structural maintenance of chromosome 3 (chondroitin sulfate proteoglycan 6)
LQFLEKRRIAIKTRDDARDKLRVLGTVPTTEIESHRGMRYRDLVKGLKEVTAALDKYAHVNKKAESQYEQFVEQRDQLVVREKELVEGNGRIAELVRALDAKKDEAIRGTFQGVMTHFTDVFKKLVPKGKASLYLTTGLDDDAGDAAEAGDGGAAAPAGGRKPGSKRKSKGGAGAIAGLDDVADNFRGLGIRASFSDADETQNITSLSGGQKSLVALALIFAIQRVDPAPFYVFDEVDSALDPIHRGAVGGLIREQAADKTSPAQFVVSTFHPEILEHVHAYFGVTFVHKVSSLSSLTKEETVAFIHAIQEEEKDKKAAEKQGGGGGKGGQGSAPRQRQPQAAAAPAAARAAVEQGSAPAKKLKTAAAAAGGRRAAVANDEDDDDL